MSDPSFKGTPTVTSSHCVLCSQSLPLQEGAVGGDQASSTWFFGVIEESSYSGMLMVGLDSGGASPVFPL